MPNMPGRKHTAAAAGAAVVGLGIIGWHERARLRHELPRLARHARYLRGKAQGARYRLADQRPRAEVDDAVLADRVRSTLGPIEKTLDIPHVHVTSERHVVLLHGDVPSARDAALVEADAAAVPGVAAVRSRLHVGLLPGDTRPTEGRARQHRPSPLLRRLVVAGTPPGHSPLLGRLVAHATLAAFAASLPAGARRRLLARLPGDVRRLAVTADGGHPHPGPARTRLALAAAVARATGLDEAAAGHAAQAVLAVLRGALTLPHAAAVSRCLPPGLRPAWPISGVAGGPGSAGLRRVWRESRHPGEWHWELSPAPASAPGGGAPTPR